jgi:hypothetical protein
MIQRMYLAMNNTEYTSEIVTGFISSNICAKMYSKLSLYLVEKEIINVYNSINMPKYYGPPLKEYMTGFLYHYEYNNI